MLTCGFLMLQAWAQAPPIKVSIAYEKKEYSKGKPVPIKLNVTNTSNHYVRISKGFTSLYMLKMRVYDQSGRLLRVKHKEGRHTEVPDAPPLAWEEHKGRLVRVAPCEVLGANETISLKPEKLSEYYDTSLPGWYSIKVELSAMVFNGTVEEPCDINNTSYIGILPFETQYFHLQGDAAVQIVPLKWKLRRIYARVAPVHVKVLIYPEKGRSLDDYRLETIRLNGALPVKIEKLSPRRKNPHIVAFFDSQEAIKSLGRTDPGQAQPAIVSGLFRNGDPFGGSQKVVIVP